jgi:rubrerythrin
LAEKLKLLYDIFKKAIESEKEAQKMYKGAISLCEDKKTIQVLNSLIRDELRHEEKLIEHYNKLKRELSIVED